MKLQTYILALIHFVSLQAKAQSEVHIRFVDSYTFEPISLELIREVNDGDFTAHAESNTISLSKPRMKKLTVVADNYQIGSFKVQMKQRWGDTLTYQLKPQQQLIDQYYSELFGDSIKADTLTFSSMKEVERKLRLYLQFVSEIDHSCDHGLCSNSNTFPYYAQFQQSAGVFVLKHFDPKSEVKCNDLDGFLNQIQINFPPFELDVDAESFRVPFTISWF